MTWPDDTWWPPTMVALPDGTSLAVRSHEGNRRPVLLMHGLASNALLWRQVAETLAARGHAVAAVDLRGHGRSEAPSTGYTTAQAAHDVTALAAALGWQASGPLVVGQSWGANVAIHSAAQSALWGGVMCVDGGWIHLQPRFADFDECWAALKPPSFGDATPEQALARIQGFVRGWPAHSVDAIMGNLEVVDGRVRNRLSFEHHRSIVHSLWEDDPATNYGRVNVPVSLIVAGKATSEDVDQALEQLPDATARWYPEAHHDIHLQQPDVVAEQVFALIDRVQGSAQ